MIVNFESTSYPGATEEICIPILEEIGLKGGIDFSSDIARKDKSWG